MILKQGDCLSLMKEIEDKSIDMILCDLPYGVTACKWDTIIPFDDLWEQYNRIIKDNGAVVLFGNEPFTSLLITSNLKGFKYRWDWNKKIPSGMVYAKYRPMQQTEDICVFTKTGKKTKYNPQMIKRDVPIKSGGNNVKAGVYSGFKAITEKKEYKKTYDYKNPVTLIAFDKVRRGALHPTQKPVELLEYLVKTYTNENDLVLDNCMGSGSTGVACVNTNRDFIGYELDENYFQIAQTRIQQAICDKNGIPMINKMSDDKSEISVA
ncbi:MAG TPA: cytosine methyltransferase [Thermosipho africanus]|nr:cytosine methyltransferase [Thermosipho africanus]